MVFLRTTIHFDGKDPNLCGNFKSGHEKCSSASDKASQKLSSIESINLEFIKKTLEDILLYKGSTTKRLNIVLKLIVLPLKLC